MLHAQIATLNLTMQTSNTKF